MTEGTAPTPEEIRRLNRTLMGKDTRQSRRKPAMGAEAPGRRDAAIREAGFLEAERLREVQESLGSKNRRLWASSFG